MISSSAGRARRTVALESAWVSRRARTNSSMLRCAADAILQSAWCSAHGGFHPALQFLAGAAGVVVGMPANFFVCFPLAQGAFKGLKPVFVLPPLRSPVVLPQEVRCLTH